MLWREGDGRRRIDPFGVSEPPGCVLRLHGIAKKKYQPHADLACAYGIGILGSIDHECRVGLSQNAGRAELRKAARIMAGVGELLAERRSREMWEAITDCIEEANEAEAMEQVAIEN